MVKKLHWNLFFVLFVLPILSWGQCPTSVGITSNQGASICQGTDVTFTANPTGGTSPVYEWTLNGTVVGSSSTYSSSSLTNQDKIRVKVSSSTDSNCETFSDIFTITVNPNRTGTLQIQASNNSICPGENISFSIASVSNAGSGAIYTWKINGNTVGNNSTSFSSSALQNNDEIQLSIQSGIPCTPDFSSNTIIIQEKPGTPSQPANISGNNSVCPGTTQTYSITNVTDASEYVWTLPSGWSGSSTTNTIDVTSGSAGGNISVQAKNSCGTSTMRDLSVSVLPNSPSTPGTITGPISVCPGISVDYSIAAVLNATEYVWALPNGTEQITNDPDITVTTNTSGSSNISVRARNSCGTSALKTLSVTVKAGKPATPGAITGDTNICPGTTQTYSITAVQGATSYNWTLPSGWTGSSTTRTITVTSNANAGDIVVTAENDCDISESRTLSISIKDGTPNTPGIISGATAVCPTTSETYTVAAVEGATEYIWTIPGSFSTTSTVTTNPTLNITAGNTGSGNITVKAKNDCGTSTAASLAIGISQPAPVLPGDITGPTNVCSTSTGISYSIPAVANATSYSWSLPPGWNITSGSTTRTITVSSSSNSGTISVIAKNDCGDSPAKSITVSSTSGVPSQPGAITSSLGNNQNICPPLSGITFTVPAVSGATGYNWKLPPGWEIATGANTRSITVNVTANAPYQNEIVSVTATNVCGDSQPQNFTNITVANFIITDLGEDQLVCRTRNQIPIDIELYFGGSNRLKPVWSTSGDGNFPDLPNIGNGNGANNIPRNFRIHYIPGPNDITREYVTITMTVPKPHQQNPCGTGIDEMRIYFLDNPTASFSTTNSEICYNTNTSLDISGTPNTSVTYSNGSGNATVALDAAGNGTIATGNLTQTTTYTLQSIAYTDGPGCSQNITSTSTITVNPIPSATFTYNDGPFCNSDSASYLPSFANTVGQFQGGTFSASGINVNATDGSFSPNGVSPDTYTITYSFNDSQSCNYADITTDIVVHDVITIPSQPTDKRVCEGDAINLSIEATGDGLGYQWYKGSGTGSPISGATSSDFNIDTSSASDSGTYYVIITGISPCTELKSEEIEVIVDQNIEITEISTDAPNNEICEGGSVTFAVSAAAGSETLQYQWYNSNGPISGATGETYILSNTSLTNADEYYVEISASNEYLCNSATSETITLDVNEIPNADISYSGPFCNSDSEVKSVSFSNTAGDYTGGSFSFTVISDGNNLDINTESGEIDPSKSDPGVYEISYNTAESGGCAQVIEITQVTITEAPTANISFANDQTEFCNDASQGIITPILTGTGNYTGGAFDGISGINTSTGAIDLNGIVAGNYSVTYSIPASEGCPSQIVSIDIVVNDKINITSQPFNIGACSGAEIELEVAASGVDLNYQWFKGTYPGAAITGANTSIFGISPVNSTDNGIYYVEVSAANSCSLVRSEEVTVSVDENIIVTTQPQDESACSGDDITFNIAATANGGSVSYQWMFNGANLTGETGDSLTLTSLSLADAGKYSVFIEGPDGYTCSTITSGAATLTVNEPPTINAGDNFEVCTSSYSFNIGEDATASNFSSLQWSSSGGGTFSDETALQTTYFPATGETGSVTLTLTANGNGVCSSITDDLIVNIEPLPVISLFEYAAEEFCVSISNTQAPTITGENAYLNGTFSVTPTDAGDLLSIDAAGNINPSLSDPGEYLITYATPSSGICDVVEADFTVIIGDLPDASFSYDAEEYCRNTREDSVTDPAITINAGGESADSFSYTGSGNLELESTTGAIDIYNSEAGEYIITRTIDYSGDNEDGCDPVSETFTITINDKPIPDFTYASAEFCSDETDPSPTAIINGVFGVFTFAPTAGEEGNQLSINPSSGEIDLDTSDPGSYIITNTVDNSDDVCEEVSFEFEMTIYEKKDPTFTYTKTDYCISELQATVTPGFASGGTFSSTTIGNNYLDPATGQIDWNIQSSITGTHNITYTIPTNGTCEAVSHDFEIRIDALPEGGEALWSKNNERLFLTCANPVSGYASTLNLIGYVGEIIGWEYRGSSSTSWSSINSINATLTEDQIESAVSPGDESTVFRALLSNNSCDGGVYSEPAIVSVIIADIKPTPVQVDKDIICIGDTISLSSQTGYSSTGEKFEGGQFTEAGIKNKGWRFTNPSGGSNDYSAAANNGRADHWLKMNASGGPNGKVFTGNLPNYNNPSTIRWTSILNVNEKFALVTGDNVSLMETPVFALNGMDEAIFTWDQGYNLSEGAKITVEISTNGGADYNTVLYTLTSDGSVEVGSSGNYLDFGGGTPQSRPKNKMVINLGDYLGQSNLRVRFNYEGVRDGDVWAVDNVKVPEGPQVILLQWYYDEDLDNPDNELEEIGEVNEYTVNFIPRKIGWNDFEVQTRIILDSNGDQCQSVDNFETIRVWAFDEYITEVSTTVGACGSLSIVLNATVTATEQAMQIVEYPTLDGYVGSWKVFDSNNIEITTGFSFENQDNGSNLEPVKDPNAIFTAENLGDYQIRWVLTPTATDENGVLIENEGCPPIDNTETISLVDCVTLDFDGYDDYVDLGNNYTGSFFLEAWIMPFDRPLPEGGMTDASKGTIFSTPGFELSMENLPDFVVPNNRWYHIAVSSNGSTLYIDGVNAGSISVNTSGTNTAAIGARYSASTKTATNHFSGWIEEVRIWNTAPSEKEIRFMMNQRLKLNSSNQVVSPIEGEVVPNRTVDGSYYTANGFNLDEDGVSFYDQTAADLAGYYRLYSNDPDPDNKLLGYFLDVLKPLNGLTPNHANAANPGRMVNIETDQENTSPTPYFSYAEGSTWTDINTWARPEVWDAPNSLGYDNNPIDWNIARINHTFESNRAITMLGLLSETSSKELTINASNPITISHYLYLDGSIDLQGESQLLQNHGSILANESGGFVEIDQQGRMSSFNYNYWTSPVSTQGSSNNSGYRLVDVLMDGTNAENPTGINWRTGYFDADGARTSPITITDAWIWDFRGGDADIYGDWLFMGNDFMQIAGAGYSMKGTDGTVAPNQMTQNYVFRGKPNNGDIPTTELSLNSTQNFLVGNPFPSALDANEFLRDNLNIVGTGAGNNSQNVFNGTLYYWDHFAGSTHILEEYVGGYATYTLAGSAPAILNDWRISQVGGNGTKEAKQYIPVAQGFFLNSAPVNGNTFGGQIQFNNTQRVYRIESVDPSIFLQQENDPKSSKNKTEKSSEDDRAKIRLKFESPAGYHRQILVTRDANTTNGFDVGYDAPLIENNKEDMYWWFADNRFVIQGVPDFEKDQVLPLAIKTSSEGSFTIKIDSTENWPANKELYLKDKQNDSIHDLLAGSYKGTTTEGEISDRFEIVFFKEIAQEPDPVVIPEEPELPVIDGLVGISYSTFSRNVKISNEDLLKVEKVLIYDMGGKLIQEFDGLPSEKEIYLALRPVRSGIYIVKVFCENAICNKKIIVK